MHSRLLLAACVLMRAQAQEEYGQQSSSAAPQPQTTPADQPIDPHTHDANGKPYVLPGEDEWTAKKRRLAEKGGGGGGARSRQSPYSRKRKRKKSWLTLLGVGGEDAEGKPKP